MKSLVTFVIARSGKTIIALTAEVGGFEKMADWLFEQQKPHVRI